MIHPEVAAERFVKTLRALRKEQKISQDKMGKILRVHQSAVSRIERGEQGLELWQVVRVCQLFGRSFEEMAGVSQ